jgi:hypothetical protein
MEGLRVGAPMEEVCLRHGVRTPNEPRRLWQGSGNASRAGSKHHLGGRNGFSSDRVRPLSGVFLACTAERNVDSHLLLGPVWDELLVCRSGEEGLGSAARHAEEGRKSPEGSSGTEWTRVEWLGFCLGSGWGRIYVGSEWAIVGRIRRGGRTRA